MIEHSSIFSRHETMADIGNKERGIGPDTKALDRAISVSNTDSGATSHELRANTFPSASAAARDAIRTFNPISIMENREFGGTIYRLPGSNKFSYVTPPNIQRSGIKGGSVLTAQEIPVGATEVGRWHTHGKTENFTDEDFSADDIGLARARGIPSWIGTPRGAIKVAVPTKTGVVVLDVEPVEGMRPNIRFVPR